MKPPVIQPSRFNEVRVRRAGRAAWWPPVLGGALLIALWLFLAAYVRAGIEVRPVSSGLIQGPSASVPATLPSPRPRAAPATSQVAPPIEAGPAVGAVGVLTGKGAEASRAQATERAPTVADSVSSAGLQAEIDRVVAADPVEFRYLKFQLRNKSRRLLQGLGKRLAGEAGKFTVEIRVHANTWGSRQRNLEVSTRRASVVREVLLAAGLPESRLRAEGVGEAEPRRGSTEKETRRLNRRTEIRIVRN